MAGLIAGNRMLSVSAAPTFAAKWLAPRLYQFQASHPFIELQLRADGTLTDLARDPNVDVAIRYGKGTYGANLQIERLWAEDVVIAVGSPEVAKQLVQPSDLTKARILRTSMPAGSELLEPIGWRAWFSKAEVTGRQVEDAISAAPLFSTTQLALEAAATGKGLALAPRLLVADDLRAGKLVKLFEISITDPFGFWVLYRRERTDEVKIRAFVQWLKSIASI
jgi:LysR family transcriptional regulator, glycine cleavage system transcriptional activator